MHRLVWQLIFISALARLSTAQDTNPEKSLPAAGNGWNLDYCIGHHYSSSLVSPHVAN